MLEKFRTFLIPLSIIIAGILIAGAFFYLDWSKGKILSSQEVTERVMKFIKENVSGGETASLISIIQEGDIYKIKLQVNGQEYDSYASRDGKLLFPTAYNLEATSTEENQSENSNAPEITKNDKPDVKLFVMSYCPYGLQAEKMFLPVYDLLKDKADMGVYFVDYIMHEKIEIDENLRQYCIQKEEPEKYSGYLSCFAANGDYQKCFSQAGINVGRIENCFFDTDLQFRITTLYNNKESWLSGRYPKFDVQADLNEKYGIQGSPTVVINDEVVEVSPRTPEKFKEIVCSAFNAPPGECSQTLSNEVPSAGIGTGTGSASAGGCEQ